MLIKKADDRSADIETLKVLSTRPDASQDARKFIDREILNIQSGMRGEAEAAYEMEFHYGASKNWVIIHDLRLECEGRVAQIDHLLINRFLEIYVCESKSFSQGVAVNEQGEFSAFFGSKPYGIPSPLEQNRRHMAVLESVFKTGLVAPPKRLGFTISPSLHGLVLVSKTARISRPKAKIDGIETVIKNDQLKAKIDRDIDKDNNILGAAKIVGQDTLEHFAQRLAAAHKPIRFDWLAKFGLPAIAPDPVKSVAPVHDGAPPVSSDDATGERKSKLACSSCGTVVAYNVAKFCWFNKSRFDGKVFCMECQKTASVLNAAP
ncbi:NERD domain-containing protein (plasmid) [Aeromonas media]|uniref:NERD domain-containing protein n=2 Tax=Aeromonas media TaxID=651 RepID=A0ABX6P008_AERME|nr:NERD domain-containing protein [Aeromonas media]QJT41378.1 NERD domain-containing protein [Aeromonas media]